MKRSDKSETPVLTMGLHKKICPRSKRSQMKMSFGMIFSIILIIAFIATAFYAITKFLDLQEAAKIGQFKSNLQEDVDIAWRGTQTTKEGNYNLPTKTEKVCFVDQEDYGYNIELRPNDKFLNTPLILIKHINISIITLNGAGAKCFDVNDGKVSMNIEKNFGESWVVIK